MPDPTLNALVGELLDEVRDQRAALGAATVATVESDRRIEANTAATTQLAASTRRSKRHVRILAVSVTLDVLLSVATGWAVNVALSASHRATNATKAASALAAHDRTELISNCVAGNVVKLQQLAVWKQVLDVPARTPAGRAALAADLAAVRKAYAPKDCTGE